MITVVISENYEFKKNEKEIDALTLNSINPSLFDDDKVCVYDADLNGFNKDMLDFVIKNATKEIKIISSDYKIVEGRRSGKNLKIDKSEIQKEGNPWDITKVLLEAVDRKELFQYLKDNKVHLFMPLMILTSNFDKLTERNLKVLQKLEQWLFKVNNEMLYGMIAFGMEAQACPFLKWRYPKKGEKKNATES